VSFTTKNDEGYQRLAEHGGPWHGLAEASSGACKRL
jgi:hypothetical protein